MIQQLKRARQALATGWVGPKLEPWCRDERGRRVHFADEAVHTYSVFGALQLGGELGPALELLGRVVSPGVAAFHDFCAGFTVEQLRGIEWDEPETFEALEAQWWQLQVRAAGEFMSFTGWLCQATRTAEDVLRVFTTAALRSAREKRT